MKKFFSKALLILCVTLLYACQTNEHYKEVLPATTLNLNEATANTKTSASTISLKCPATKYYFVAQKGDNNKKYAPFFEKHSNVIAIFQKENTLYGIVNETCKGDGKQIIPAKAQGIQEGPCVKTEICVINLTSTVNNGKAGLLSMLLEYFGIH
jgi:hypothetical protein